MAIETLAPNRRTYTTIIIRDGTVRVPFNKGFEAIIDVADMDLVSNYRWHAMVGSTGNVYARGTVGISQIFMHRILMQAQKGEQIDHIDGDGLTIEERT